MEEILHHLGCMKPYKLLDKLHINWCSIPAINCISRVYPKIKQLSGPPDSTKHQVYQALLVTHNPSTEQRLAHLRDFPEIRALSSMLLYLLQCCLQGKLRTINFDVRSLSQCHKKFVYL